MDGGVGGVEKTGSVVYSRRHFGRLIMNSVNADDQACRLDLERGSEREREEREKS